MKLLTTFCTRKFWFIMKLHVFSQSIFCFEASVVRADHASEFSLIAMTCLMSLQCDFPSKFFIASRTRIRFITCMCSIVPIKMCFTCKTLQANFTLIGFLMNVLMIAKSTLASKLLIASQAFKLSFIPFSRNTGV